MKKEAYNWLGELAIIHASAKDTDGRYCMIELYATPEGAPPPHIHQREDEGFLVLEGEITLRIGERTLTAKAGDFFIAPKGIPHSYDVTSKEHARVMLICSPAGFEDCVREMSTPTDSLVPPEPNSAKVDYNKVADIASKYGIEFVEPQSE